MRSSGRDGRRGRIGGGKRGASEVERGRGWSAGRRDEPGEHEGRLSEVEYGVGKKEGERATEKMKSEEAVAEESEPGRKRDDRKEKLEVTKKKAKSSKGDQGGKSDGEWNDWMVYSPVLSRSRRMQAGTSLIASASRICFAR